MKLGELAARLECQLEGPEDLEITGVAGMDEAHAGEITFLSNPKYVRKLRTTRAGAIIAGPRRRHVGQTGVAFRRSLHVVCSGARGFLSTLSGRPREFIPPPSSPRTRSWGAIPRSALMWSSKPARRLATIACSKAL